MDKNELGRLGENIATDFLVGKGYKILHRNWTYYKLELDIICEFDQKIIFVEVKTRESDYMGQPWESVTKAKQKHIIRAANEYLMEYNIDQESRFDIISIIYKPNEKRIEHLEEAFYPLV